MDQVSKKDEQPVGLALFRGIWLGVFVIVLTFQVGGFFWWPQGVRAWIAFGTALPIAIPIVVAIVAVGANTTSNPWIRRDSALWRWMRGVGAAFNASAGVAIGALLGAIVGAGVATSTTVEDLGPSVRFVLLIVAIGVSAAVIWWSSVVAVDMHQLGAKKRAKGARRAFGNRKLAARVASELSGPAEVGLCGVLIVMFIWQIWASVGASLGAV